ncbi:WD40 repeat domain-containing protein [Nocardia sp. PE-7]|uniref:WD40 repeat domain-containing protein n=1 Tax=Nocardia sp. PE-7 TaxID=3058426 RepID=UPI00265A8B9B|nr:WD40 repeat domain-containing protein [Nocardia sp. PE-7]WKG08133.1 WD40 repeat domain-containing protein [Nocardia sp. PE-7]
MAVESTDRSAGALSTDDAVLIELTGAPQRWLALCRDAVAAGPDAARRLLEHRRETGVLARQSLARWKNLAADEDLLEEESEDPDAQDRRITADLSAARAMAVLAQALTGSIDIDDACEAFLDHAERAGLISVGTQLLPAGIPITSANAPLGEIVRHLLGQGGRAGRGYAIMAALELAGHTLPVVRSSRISVLFLNFGGGGEVGVLRLDQVRGGPSGLHPDPARMGFLQADREFTDSLERAWRISRLAGTDACVRWSVSTHGSTPANDINGASMGAAFAVALDDLAPRHALLRRLRPRRLDPECAVTAGLSGTNLTAVGGYAGKLTAAQRSSLRVVVASEAYRAAADEAPQNYADRISAARTVSEAIARTRTRANLALWMVSVAAGLAVLLAVGSVTELVQLRIENAAARAESNSRLFAGVARGGGNLNPALSQQIALAAYRTAPTEEARSALLENTATNAPIRISPGVVLGRGVVFDPDAPRIATTPQGEVIAIGEGDGSVELVRVTESGVDRWPRFATDSGHIRGIAISANHEWLVVAGDLRSALWNIADPGAPRPVTQFPLAGRLPSSVALSPDLEFVAIGTHSATVSTWRLGDDPAHPVALPTQSVSGQRAEVALSDHTLVAAVPSLFGGVWTTTVRGWNAETLDRDQTPVFDRRLERPGGAEARSVEFTGDGTVLAVALNPGEVARWRVGASTFEPMPAVMRGANEYLDVSLTEDGRSAVIVGGDSRARIRDLDTGVELVTLPIDMVARARFLRGGRSLVTTSFDHAVHVFALPGPVVSTSSLTLFRFPLDQPVLSQELFPHLRMLARTPFATDRTLLDGDPAGLIDVVAIAPGGIRAVTRTESTIQVWDIADPVTPRRVGAPLSAAGVDIRAITFSPDGTLAIGRSMTQTVDIFDVSDEPRLLTSIRFGRGYPTSLAFSPDGSMLAVGSHRTGNVSVFATTPAAPTIAELSDLRTPGQTMSLALSSRDTLAVGTLTGAFVYEIGKPGRPPRGLTVPVGANGSAGSVAFDPGGTRLAVDDILSGTILLWDYSDPANPTAYATITRGQRHRQPTMLAFAADGAVLTESAVDGTLRRWRTDAAAEADRICASGTTPITREEWTGALPGHAYVNPCPER